MCRVSGIILLCAVVLGQGERTRERAELQWPGSAASGLWPCSEGWQCLPHLPLASPALFLVGVNS